MKSVDQIYTDDCTYASRETLFVTKDTTRKEVYEELCKVFIMTEDQFIELNCDGSVEVEDNRGSKVTIEVNHVKVV